LANRISHKKTKINNENSIKGVEWVERSYKFDSLSFLLLRIDDKMNKHRYMMTLLIRLLVDNRTICNLSNDVVSLPKRASASKDEA
jgi:hypothetical protein